MGNQSNSGNSTNNNASNHDHDHSVNNGVDPSTCSNMNGDTFGPMDQLFHCNDCGEDMDVAPR